MNLSLTFASIVERYPFASVPHKLIVNWYKQNMKDFLCFMNSHLRISLPMYTILLLSSVGNSFHMIMCHIIY